jgi:hypothetical protein
MIGAEMKPPTPVSIDRTPTIRIDPKNQATALQKWPA